MFYEGILLICVFIRLIVIFYVKYCLDVNALAPMGTASFFGIAGILL